MLRKIFILLGVGMTCLSSVKAQNIDSLYNAIDKAIAANADYLAAKTKTIDSLRSRMNHAATLRQSYDECLKLYEAYETFQNDSAVSFLKRCVKKAEEMKTADLKGHCLLRLVRQYSRSGFYSEAVHYLQEVDKKNVSKEDLPMYHETYRFLYGEMASYTQDDDMRSYYFSVADSHRDTILTIALEHSVTYLTAKENVLLSKHEYAAAMLQNDELLKLIEPSSPQFATVAFFRAMELEGLKQMDQAKVWLAKSALCDVRNSVMDQASLWTLAGILDKEGQTERSYNYVEYSWDCTQWFGARMRSWSVSPIVNKINTNQKERLSQSNTRLIWMIIAISILALLVVAQYLMVARKSRQLAAARKKLSEANGQLEDTNKQLSVLNSQLEDTNGKLSAKNEDLSTLNAQLTEANLIKEEYIGQFLSICSDYIEKIEKMRIVVNRKVKAHQYDDLLRMSEDTNIKKKEVEQLNDNFDAVFLHLFPNFVKEFNDLLQPDHRIPQEDSMRLPTVIRIFALVRLGIDDSYHISQFLHFTPNTIYNYRSRTKTKAIIRDTFEADVKKIGK